MNKKNITILFSCLAITIQFFQTIKASQYAPNVIFQYPFKDAAYLCNSSITFSAGYAHQAFNRNGNLVPFLEQYGPEDFLQRFVNPSLGPDNLESAGQGLISGEYHFKQVRFLCEKNIYHHLVIGAIISLQDISITNITPRFINAELPLSADQIIYLEKLEQKIPSTINQCGMYSTNIFFGYNEKLENFNHIHSFKAMLLAGITTPQAMKNDNRSILQYPGAANFHFGYPVIGAITAEIRDWFTIGCSGLAIPFQPVTMIIPINKTGENNHILFSQATLAKIDQAPFFSATLYGEIQSISSGYSGYIGYSYSQYLRSTITPIDTVQFPKAHANRSILLDGYSLGAILLQINKDCSRPGKTVAPIISLFFSVPVVGKLYQKTFLFGGSCNLQVSYDF